MPLNAQTGLQHYRMIIFYSFQYLRYAKANPKNRSIGHRYIEMYPSICYTTSSIYCEWIFDV